MNRGKSMGLAATLLLLLGAWVPVAPAAEEDTLALDLSAPATAPQPRPRDPCLARGPRLDEVVRQAWHQAGLEPESDRRRLARARLSGWLPRLSGGLARDHGGRWSWRYEQGSQVDQLQQDAGWSWQVELSWDLAKTAWSTAELQQARENSRRALERLEIAGAVVQLWLERRRLLVEPGPGSDRVRLRLAEVTALLDAWTGGRFRDSWCEVEP